MLKIIKLMDANYLYLMIQRIGFEDKSQHRKHRRSF